MKPGWHLAYKVSYLEEKFQTKERFTFLMSGSVSDKEMAKEKMQKVWKRMKTNPDFFDPILVFVRK